MPTTYETVTVAGQNVLAEIAAHKAATVTKRGSYYDSESLCAHQRAMSQRGYTGAELVESNYGWSVRYSSGLQDFGLIASARARQVDGTLEDAERYAREWQALDPGRRYVTRTVTREG